MAGIGGNLLLRGKDFSKIRVFNKIDLNGISNLSVISKNQKDITEL